MASACEGWMCLVLIRTPSAIKGAGRPFTVGMADGLSAVGQMESTSLEKVDADSANQLLHAQQGHLAPSRAGRDARATTRAFAWREYLHAQVTRLLTCMRPSLIVHL